MLQAIYEYCQAMYPPPEETKKLEVPFPAVKPKAPPQVSAPSKYVPSLSVNQGLF